MKRLTFTLMAAAALTTLAPGCTPSDGDDGGDAGETAEPLDPDTAPEVEIDRFSPEAGTLMVRDDQNGLPGSNEAIDFDMAPFITTGLGPDGTSVRYYNFDVQPTEPAPIYVLFREGEDSPVAGQLNIVDVIPGDAGYNDFWNPIKVTVPTDYVANTITSYEDISAAGLAMEPTDALVNCPIVPEGSTATLRYGGADAGLVRGWYDDQVVYYFEFSEAALVDSGAGVPLSPIYVTFNINPDQEGGGPPSGFVTEEGTDQTHNVIATVPGDEGYSPLWLVNIYDNAEFDSVSDLASAEMATILAAGAATVNCPVVTGGA
jgi:hypothetical protein